MAKGMQGNMVYIAWHFTCIGHVAENSINKGQWGNEIFNRVGNRMYCEGDTALSGI